MRVLIHLIALVVVVGLPLFVVWLVSFRNTKNRQLAKENKRLWHALNAIEEDAADVAVVGNVETQLNYATQVAEMIRNLRRKELS